MKVEFMMMRVEFMKFEFCYANVFKRVIFVFQLQLITIMF